MFTAWGIYPLLAALTSEPLNSLLDLASIIDTFLLFKNLLISLAVAKTLKFTLPLNSTYFGGLVFISTRYPSIFHFSNPPSRILTLL